jgi:predicted metal-binding protein
MATARQKEYRAYIKSDKWKMFRSSILIARGGKCERCGCTKGLEIHHRTYKNFKNEKPQDVMVVCAECHDKIHGRVYSEELDRKVNTIARKPKQTPKKAKRQYEQVGVKKDSEEFLQYLKSNEWRELKDSVLAEKMWKCDKCNETGGVSARHKIKHDFKKQDKNNIEVVCKTCKKISEQAPVCKKVFCNKAPVSFEKKSRLEKAMKNWKQTA